MGQCFGTADFYSFNLQQFGHEATEVVTNCEELQRQWANEHGIKLDENRKWELARRRGVPWLRRAKRTDWFYTVLAAQVKQYRPDVLYVQDMNEVSAIFLHEMRPHVRLIVGQIACAIAKEADFTEYDLILSSFPHFVERFRREGCKSEYLKLGFEPRVLNRLSDGKRYGAVFVGGLSRQHQKRTQFFEELANHDPVDFWGYGFDELPRNSPLHKRYHGDAWGLEMYRVLHEAKIALNFHIDVAGPYANNCRLFEAAGVGALLMTDWKINLSEIFEVGKEVIAYRTSAECAELSRYYLEHEDERKAIAAAGQRRIMAEHTYQKRMEELAAILEQTLSVIKS